MHGERGRRDDPCRTCGCPIPEGQIQAALFREWWEQRSENGRLLDVAEQHGMLRQAAGNDVCLPESSPDSPVLPRRGESCLDRPIGVDRSWCKS